MKNIILIAVISVLSAIGACNNNSKSGKSKPLIVASDSSKEKYQCPMKDQGDTAYTTEGQCPACGMDLEKIK